MKVEATGKVFRANELTHPNRRWADGLPIVASVDHKGVGPAVCALTPERADPSDHVRYGVQLDGGEWEWATPNEIVSACG